MKSAKKIIVTIIGVSILFVIAIASQYSGDTNILESDNHSEQTILLNHEALTHTTHMTEPPEDEQELRIYRSSYDFPFKEIAYADEDACIFLRSSYEKVDFYGEFEKGDLETYSFYKQNYFRLVSNEVPFIIPETGSTSFVREFEQLDPVYDTIAFDPENYAYLFFDMDEDSSPELCIKETPFSTSFTYIFKYIPDKDKFILLHELYPSHYQLNGCNKIRWDGVGGSFDANVFYKIGKDGQEEYTFYFFSRGILNYETDEWEHISMIGLPHYNDKNSVIKLPDEVKKQAYYAEGHEIYYFRVPEEQYMDLTTDYWNAKVLAREKIKEVTYTYEELFGEFVR